MPKVEISGHFIRDEKIMTRIIDAGFVLKNKQHDPLNDFYAFDIEGPEMPDCEAVVLCMNDQGGVWVEPQPHFKPSLSTLIIERINRYFVT